MQFRLATLLVFLASGWLLSGSLRAVDRTRKSRAAQEGGLLVPDGAQMRTVATGFEEPLADLIWIRAVLLFGDSERASIDPNWVHAFHAMVDATMTLDPTWRTPPYWGGVMLRVADDLEASDDIFKKGVNNIPTEPFFPFSLGINAYLYRDDAATAAQYYQQAAALPDAPTWYASAAAGMHQSAGRRDIGITYLRDLLTSTNDPAVRAETERQLGRLIHNDMVDQWAEACKRYRAEQGRPLPAPEALALLGWRLPTNPRGDAWVVGGDGVVRSEGAEAERLRRLRRQELKLLVR